ncbi:hypothetical protein [Leptotrichia massiliensis]|uniref:hypothetical protein n=1 Tax=Leptotrichia massiliensis TaxID=1852388 RepID=UPI0008DAE3D4|nr:hypothetical protein [Leptotrichia massiliensis]
MEQGTNSRPTSPKPKKPEAKIFQYSPKENLEKINKIALKVLEVIEDITEDEFDIIIKLIRNEFKKLNGNRNRNFEFKIKFKEVMLKQFKEALEKIYDSKGVL